LHKAFDVNASLIRFGTVNLTFLSQRKRKGIGMFTRKTSKIATYLSSGKERGFTLEGAKPI
jgi:hypothetical protein